MNTTKNVSLECLKVSASRSKSWNLSKAPITSYPKNTLSTLTRYFLKLFLKRFLTEILALNDCNGKGCEKSWSRSGEAVRLSPSFRSHIPWATGNKIKNLVTFQILKKELKKILNFFNFTTYSRQFVFRCDKFFFECD